MSSVDQDLGVPSSLQRRHASDQVTSAVAMRVKPLAGRSTTCGQKDARHEAGHPNQDSSFPTVRRCAASMMPRLPDCQLKGCVAGRLCCRGWIESRMAPSVTRHRRDELLELSIEL